MAKSKPPESQPISKKVVASARKSTQSIEKLRGRIAEVEELMKDGIPYRDALRVKAEFHVRETIREIFGEASPEYQTNQQHRINTNDETEITKTLSMLRDLIAGLEGKKPGLPDGRTAKQDKAPIPAQPVEPAAPAEPPPATSADHPSVAFLQQTRLSDQEAGSGIGADEPRTAPTPLPSEARSPLEALGFIRKLCTRFHALVRELRQRSENRPPFDVEDEHDVRDLLRALLCLEFEDLSVEEWTPPHGGGKSRTDFVLKRERIVIVVKKTRQGLGAKEIADQLAIDFQRYSIHPNCHTLLCFVYDPEGRVVNPRRLEANLTQESGGRTVEVLIAPQ